MRRMLDRKALSDIAQALRQIAIILAAAAAAKPTAAKKTTAPARAKPTLSPARRDALRWQGRYMVAVKMARPREAARLRAIYAKRGPRAAVQSRKRA